LFGNQVWHEYIANRHHLHMNATIWETLTNFIKYLGKTGKAVVDNTPKARPRSMGLFRQPHSVSTGPYSGGAEAFRLQLLVRYAVPSGRVKPANWSLGALSIDLLLAYSAWAPCCEHKRAGWATPDRVGS
jgi:hypothetical protein